MLKVHTIVFQFYPFALAVLYPFPRLARFMPNPVVLKSFGSSPLMIASATFWHFEPT